MRRKREPLPGLLTATNNNRKQDANRQADADYKKKLAMVSDHNDTFAQLILVVAFPTTAPLVIGWSSFYESYPNLAITTGAAVFMLNICTILFALNCMIDIRDFEGMTYDEAHQRLHAKP